MNDSQIVAFIARNDIGVAFVDVDRDTIIHNVIRCKDFMRSDDDTGATAQVIESVFVDICRRHTASERRTADRKRDACE
jgi:hypothetical protein